MALRHVERQKALAQIGKRPALLSEVELTGRDGSTHRFNLSSVMSVVTGRNGGGKTTLLRALEGFLRDPVDYRDSLFASASLSGEMKGKAWSIATGGVETPEFPVVYIDGVRAVLQMISQIEQDQQPEDWLEGIDPAPLADDLFDWAQYIIGREYEEILVYEVTAFSPEDEPEPFFRVRAHGQTYSSTEMGRGELATFHLLWQMHQLDQGSLVLIEEPESNLADYSQPRMLEALAVTAKVGGHQFVVSSHYPEAYRCLPGTTVVQVEKLPVLSLWTTTPRQQGAELAVADRGVVNAFVEDDVALSLLQCVAEETAPSLGNSLRVWKLGSESTLTLLSKELATQRNASQPGILVVLDGDRRGYVSANGRAAREPWLCCLPGETAPEELLKCTLQTSLRGNTVLAPSVTWTLLAALRDNEGLEIHDWFFACQQEFGSYLGLWKAAWPLLMTVEEVRMQSEHLGRRLLDESRYGDSTLSAATALSGEGAGD